jgi:hypothetical protein
MRAAMYELLTGYPALTDIVPVERWFQAGAVVDVPPMPFVIMRWLAPTPLTGRLGHQLQVQVHDERGDYSRIDEILRLVDTICRAVVQFQGTDGRIVQIDVLPHSGDQESPVYGSNYRFSALQVIGVNNG